MAIASEQKLYNASKGGDLEFLSSGNFKSFKLPFWVGGRTARKVKSSWQSFGVKLKPWS